MIHDCIAHGEVQANNSSITPTPSVAHESSIPSAPPVAAPISQVQVTGTASPSDMQSVLTRVQTSAPPPTPTPT